ncbi:hypothetical protein H257_04556 [Aphanomyces astaci]|uniref:Uncharacterized protein n=1 Tax=Aphanomyces astaci TaxID=112090 RepID=W4GUR1_APHAT|nr:hypothetical protein H257_04556 [Aphanomyces astaci]ETV82759.1 hypothetical protein H257_04556 [Aphanomyces astaci]|eukprot:XP_009827430.1 hypothetical protein H257_04556 [Aphanomyces astaci]
MATSSPRYHDGRRLKDYEWAIQHILRHHATVTQGKKAHNSNITMASKSNYITMASPSATSFETPDGASTPTVAVAKLHRANRIAMIVFLLCSITGVVLWYVFDTPVGHFTRSPPANTAGACHACALLNTTTNAVNRHQSQYYYFNECVSTTFQMEKYGIRI